MNSRTTEAHPRRDLPTAPIVKARMQMANARRMLGTPLATRLTASQEDSRHHDHARLTLVLQAIGGTVAGTGLLLGLIQKSLPVASVSALLVLGIGMWAYMAAKQTRKTMATPPFENGTLIDASDVERLDNAMEKLAAQAPQETVNRLASLKESITRCIQLAHSTQTNEGFSGEDHFYIRECIRRYIPDSINGCLQIPQKDRTTLVIDGKKPAMDLLHDQIDMIRGELDIKETRLTQLTGESLMQQHHFLSAKTGTKT